ncbi:MAG: ABC transporter permease [Candidatus Paceibacterota bacterium]
MNYVGLYTLIRREIARMFRITVQTVGAPLISAFLFIFIFGFILGKKIDSIAGIPYIEFVFPGILTMNVLTSAFQHTSSAVYFGRWVHSIEEVLVAPFSYFEMVAGYVISSLVRAMIVGLGVIFIGLAFGAVALTHPLLFLLYLVGVAVIFALVGILVGLWAQGFEQLNILNTFIIMPLSFLGGMFYSVELLPDLMKTITFANPFFYLIDAMRYATLGFHESNLGIGALIFAGLIIGLGALVIHLFRIGWRLRE